MRPRGVACHERPDALVLSMTGRRCAVALGVQGGLAAIAAAAAGACLDRPLLAAALVALAIAFAARALRPLLSGERVELTCDDVVVRRSILGGCRARRTCLTEVGVFEPGRIGAGLALDAATRRWVADRLNRRLGALRGWR